MIDTSGTCYEFKSWATGVWALAGQHELLKSLGLREFDDFFMLRGEVVDRNRRSQVHKLQLGSPPVTFYLKLHKGYVTRSWKSCFRAESVIQKELANMMHYARAGLKALVPVAWGWHPHRGGGDSFVLINELEGYRSLEDWTSDRTILLDADKLNSIFEAVARMLVCVHGAGLAHLDLFSWHVFLKEEGDKFLVQPIDLERSMIKGRWPWSSRQIRKKQASDLAALHLTTPWPQISFSKRMRFFLAYCGHKRLSMRDKVFLRRILEMARHRGRMKKFRSYGVGEMLRRHHGPGRVYSSLIK